MNANIPFHSDSLHWEHRVKAYCAKVLPLVFDNTLSYYESLLHFCHKVNECIEALNAQNLNIIEFEHMVQVEIQKFEDYVGNVLDSYQEQWDAFKQEVQTMFDDFKSQIEAEWEAEQALNATFRQTMETQFNNFKAEVNTSFETLRTGLLADLNTFKNNLEEQQDDFEDHILDLQTAFESREQAARVAYQNNLNNLFDQWKVDTLNAFNTNISDWEDTAKADLQSYFTLFIAQEISGRIASLQTEIGQLEHNLSTERNARQEADTGLQRQINQLTPEGSIKADAPDEEGLSQLYVIDPVTLERENLFPKVRIVNDRIYYNVDTVGNASTAPLHGLYADTGNFSQQRRGNRSEIWENLNEIPVGVSYFDTAIRIPISLIPVSSSYSQGISLFNQLDFEIVPIPNYISAYVPLKNVSILPYHKGDNESSASIRIGDFYIDGTAMPCLVVPLAIFNSSESAIAANQLHFKLTISYYIGKASVLGNNDSGSDVTIDTEMSSTSTNPVQNRVIYNALAQHPTTTEMNAALTQKADTSVVTALSAEVNQKANYSTVQALETAVANKISYTDIQYNLDGSNNLPVSNAVLKTALDNKVSLTDYATADHYGLVRVDNFLSSNSTNPVANAVLQSTFVGKADKNEAVFSDGVVTDGTVQLHRYSGNAQVNVLPKTKGFSLWHHLFSIDSTVNSKNWVTNKHQDLSTVYIATDFNSSQFNSFIISILNFNTADLTPGTTYNFSIAIPFSEFGSYFDDLPNTVTEHSAIYDNCFPLVMPVMGDRYPTVLHYQMLELSQHIRISFQVTPLVTIPVGNTAHRIARFDLLQI